MKIHLFLSVTVSKKYRVACGLEFDTDEYVTRNEFAGRVKDSAMVTCKNCQRSEWY